MRGRVAPIIKSLMAGCGFPFQIMQIENSSTQESIVDSATGKSLYTLNLRTLCNRAPFHPDGSSLTLAHFLDALSFMGIKILYAILIIAMHCPLWVHHFAISGRDHFH